MHVDGNNIDISVIMPVYNAQKHLNDAINSILSQTLNNFEFIIIDDFSTDSTKEIINCFLKKDSRIRYIENEEQLGVTRSLNIGIELAKGKYIARMDTDDISLPERFIKQFDFMEKNPDVGVCGSYYEIFGSREKILKNPVNHDKIRTRLFFKPCIGHPTVMMRSEILKKVKYNEKFTSAQDYDLWARLGEITKLYNYPEILLKYRSHDKQISTKSNTLQTNMANEVRKYYLEKLNISPNQKELLAYNFLCDNEYDKVDLNSLESFFYEVILKNREIIYFPIKEFEKMIILKYWRVCKEKGGEGVKSFRNSKLSNNIPYPFSIYIKSLLYSIF